MKQGGVESEDEREKNRDATRKKKGEIGRMRMGIREEKGGKKKKKRRKHTKEK